MSKIKKTRLIIRKGTLEDSFKSRYSPELKKFHHKLIGTIRLPGPFISKSNTILIKAPKSDIITTRFKNPVFTSNIDSGICMKKLKLIQSFAFIRRLLSVFRHYKQLNLHLFPKQKCFEFFPGVPYGLPSSKDFIKACKNGKTGIINEFIDQNK